jgi:hypothetical protein
MMVIPAGRKKERARVSPDRLVETERQVTERFGLVEIADVQVDVPHRGAIGHPGPFGLAARCDHVGDVERLGGHDQLRAPGSPCRAGAIGVDLYAEAIRIGQVERLDARLHGGAWGRRSFKEDAVRRRPGAALSH